MITATAKTGLQRESDRVGGGVSEVVEQVKVKTDRQERIEVEATTMFSAPVVNQ